MTDDIQRQRNRELWRDPANWRMGVIYYCPADTRIVVPKRSFVGEPSLGYTVNFAHSSSWVVLVLTVAGTVALILGVLLVTVGARLLGFL
jgi:uncharacterized membrane protein